ncbi:hypothetical protein K439DRAFT_1624589 [Ramaria rubella]|nr:hypothetical protein K439DRAFT_1624589 [Ramaria rubella]
MLSYLPTLPSRHRYKLVATLKGHQDAINSLALSTTGNVLTSGVGDGVKLWDIQSKTQLTAPKQNLLAHGPVSCLTWINHRDDPNEHLCYGTALGYLVIWAQNSRDGNFEEITAKQLGTGCKLTSTCDSMVQVWKVNARGTLHSVFSVQLNGTVPRAVGFADAFNKDTPNKEFLNKDILVFGLFDSNMHVLRGDDGKVMVTHKLGSRIGSAAISDKHNQCVIDNTMDGFDLHWLGNGAYIHTFNTGKPRRNMPKQVTFGEDRKAIVGGNDHGVAYVFDQVKGTNLDVLQHAKRGLVQTIMTNDRNGVSTIVTASSDASDDIYVHVWKYARDDETSERQVKEAWSFTFLGHCLVEPLVLGAAIMFVYQNTSLMLGDTTWPEICLTWLREQGAGFTSGGWWNKRGTRLAINPNKGYREDDINESPVLNVCSGLIRRNEVGGTVSSKGGGGKRGGKRGGGKNGGRQYVVQREQ